MCKIIARALDSSIDHWKRMRDGKRRKTCSLRSFIDDGLEWPCAPDCALCRNFSLKNNSCNGCPIKEKTGKDDCDGTPYMDALNAYIRHGVDSEQFKAASQKMINFLESLREVKS